ncbi:gamma-glutamyl-gamma-aminobutyrate hydrolase [candidate division KSB3 bacterium]|uniref:Gamma-glutamyl-gamma-aminobutyrate hydrolase n=1 Tax=candidate division KSB3 bacterium TaxID=2044937 RepID=A0A2G6K9Z3_9BACT|nr:MAG: gamma-glutamyl-gamma-aminobutyrate hydrolase [candidate division KSB3 bacterium]
MKPLIGITTHYDPRPKRIYCAVSHHYIRSVCAAGGIPIIVPVVEERTTTIEYLDIVDGLIFTGGGDVCPLSYGENPIKEVESFDVERDKFETSLFKGALRKNMPVLGICRGLQLMNTASGGTLYQDIFSQVEHVLGHCPKLLPVDTLYHHVFLTKGSRMADIFASDEICVNSYHHQAVKKVAEGFTVTARAADGIIEAIEHTGKKFVIAVQWHPEDLTVKHPIFLKLFEALVNASK